MDEVEQVVMEYIGGCNDGDLDRVLAVLHPEIELYEADSLPGPVQAIGLDEVRRYLERFATHWSEFRWEPLETRVAGDRVAVRARLQLTGRRSGIDVDREWSYSFVVADGLLLRQNGYDHFDEALAALS